MLNTIQNTISFRSLYAFGKKLPIDLSLSENPLGCSPKVEKFIKNLDVEVNNYPDPLLQKIKGKIAKKFNLSASNIFIGNGSESILKLLSEAFVSGSIIIPKVTFPLFEIASKLAGMKVLLSEMTTDLDIDLKDIEKKITKNTKLIIICNPNNPTGKVIQRRKILSFAKKVKPFVLVDEANIEFGGESVLSDVKKLDNLIVLRTLSKGYGLAGIRIGFCIANLKFIKELERISQPFPITTISEEIACIALDDDKFIDKTKRFMKKEREFLVARLKERRFKVIKSEANNLLVDVSKFADTSTDFVEKLNAKGISVVDGTSFKYLCGAFIRVSPRLRQTNLKFIQAVDEIISQVG